MNPIIIPVRSKKELKQFIKLPWKIYKGNGNWVPPLVKDMYTTLDNTKNAMFQRGPHELFLAVAADGKHVGRICTGYDERLNSEKSSNTGYITLFECIDDYGVAKALFDTASAWLAGRGQEAVRGPIPPGGTDSDEYKGLLIDAFHLPPVVMNTYNPPYYKDFFEKYGFEKEQDLYAYYLTQEALFKKDPEKTLNYAEKRYNFKVEKIDLKNNLNRDVRDMKQVMDLAIPDEWPDMLPPALEDVYETARRLIPVADPEIVVIARSEDRPVGFGIAIPDYNQVLIHMNGRITPLAALKYLWYKRRITGARFFVMFVVPEFRKKGVSHAIYYNIFMNGIKKGYTWGEGSTIGETNLRMRSDIESIGGQRYKTYRVYRKKI